MSDGELPTESPKKPAPVPGVLSLETHQKLDRGIRAMQSVLPVLDAAEACGCNVQEKRVLQQQMLKTLMAFKEHFPLAPEQMV